MFGHDAVPVDLPHQYSGMQQGLSRHVAEFSFFYCSSDDSDLILVLTYESSQMKGYELILKSEQNIRSSSQL
jgi:undecaprenyl-diphosphatase